MWHICIAGSVLFLHCRVSSHFNELQLYYCKVVPTIPPPTPHEPHITECLCDLL